MSRFPLARILDFVAKVAPFDSLDQEELDRVVERMDITYHPQGKVVIAAGGEPSQYLYLIMSGAVRISTPDEMGEEILVDMRGEGDVFGAVSLLQGRRALFSVTVEEDLVAFSLPAEDLRRLVDQNPAFQRHFSHPLARNLQALRGNNQDCHLDQMTGTESFRQMAVQMRSRVADLMSAPVLTCTGDTTVSQAAAQMTARRLGSIVVRNGHDKALGIVTDTDLRARVVALGLSADLPVSEVMTRPVMSVTPRAFAYEAMLEMTRHGVHHLVVCEDERMVGVISDHDIKVITGSSPVGLAQEMDKARNLDALASLSGRVGRVLEMLIRLGSSAEYMMAVVSEFNDRLCLKLLSINQQAMESEGLGPAPAEYSWLAAGGSGRREQAPPTLQEHALVFSPPRRGDQADAQGWFLEFARRVVRGLARCGLPSLPGGVAADSPLFCRSTEAWRETFLGWLAQPDSKVFEQAGAMFDFRPVEGETLFAIRTRGEIFQALEGNRGFLAALSRAGVRQRPPLGFMRGMVLHKSGEYGKYLDLDREVLAPLVEAVRVLALDQKVGETNTIARIDALMRRGLVSDRLANDLKGAMSLLTGMRITRFLEQQEAGGQDYHLVEPRGLNSIQLKMLKSSFAVIDKLQGILLKRYGVEASAG